MSCDVLPTCEEGLGVEKACYPDEDVREGAPQAPAALSPRREGILYPDHKNKQEKRPRARDHGVNFAAIRTGSKLEHFCPQR